MLQNSPTCSADLSSFSSSDLSSMIAAWVDQRTYVEYEKELKISSGMNFRTVAMMQHGCDDATKEPSAPDVEMRDRRFRIPHNWGGRQRHPRGAGIPYDARKDTNDGDAAQRGDAGPAPSPKRSCAQGAEPVPKLPRWAAEPIACVIMDCCAVDLFGRFIMII